jgi:hypothetical protein
VYYTPEILESAGFETEDSILQGQFIVGAVKMVSILLSTLMIDRSSSFGGRRSLLMISGLGMAVAQSMLAVNFLPSGGGGGEPAHASGSGSGGVSQNMFANSTGGDGTTCGVGNVDSSRSLHSRSAGLALGSQCLYMMFFSIGYGPVCWILAGACCTCCGCCRLLRVLHVLWVLHARAVGAALPLRLSARRGVISQRCYLLAVLSNSGVIS